MLLQEFVVPTCSSGQFEISCRGFAASSQESLPQKLSVAEELWGPTEEQQRCEREEPEVIQIPF